MALRDEYCRQRANLEKTCLKNNKLRKLKVFLGSRRRGAAVWINNCEWVVIVQVQHFCYQCWLWKNSKAGCVRPAALLAVIQALYCLGRGAMLSESVCLARNLHSYLR